MAKVDITINRRVYSVACDVGEEGRVKDLASMLDERVNALGGGAQAGDAHVLVLAGLLMAGEISALRLALEKAEEQQKADGSQDGDGREVLMQALGYLTERVETIAAQLESA